MDQEEDTSKAAKDEFRNDVVAIWAKAVDTQMHFNEMSVKSRQLGLTFVAAALGLAVFLFSRSGSDAKFEFSASIHGRPFQFHVAEFIILAAAAAVYAVKLLDLGVYHKMLRGAVAFGEDLEEVHLRKMLGRIERLGLSDIFTRVYCRERGRSSLPEGAARSDHYPALSKVVEIPSHESKPNPRVLLDIVTKQHFAMSQVAYVGDSLSKDVLMAKRAECFAVWAKYGAHTNREMYERLIRISHWTAEDIQLEKNYAVEAKNITPDFVCERSIVELV
jgi:histidinol phosphatase-like enzyme